jgi:tight adherence protein C
MIAHRRAVQRRGAMSLALPDAIELIVVAVRAGLSPIGAVRSAATLADPVLADAFDQFEHRLARGGAFSDALSDFGETLGPAARSLVDTLATAERYGLPLAPALDRLVDEARRERRRLAAQAARRLPVALSFPLVVCSLPAFVLLAVVPAVLGAIASLRDSLP